jgi:hypothetical protein
MDKVFCGRGPKIFEKPLLAFSRQKPVHCGNNRRGRSYVNDVSSLWVFRVSHSFGTASILRKSPTRYSKSDSNTAACVDWPILKLANSNKPSMSRQWGTLSRSFHFLKKKKPSILQRKFLKRVAWCWQFSFVSEIFYFEIHWRMCFKYFCQISTRTKHFFKQTAKEILSRVIYQITRYLPIEN